MRNPNEKTLQTGKQQKEKNYQVKKSRLERLIIMGEGGPYNDDNRGPGMKKSGLV